MRRRGQGGVQGTPGTPGPPELTTGPQPLGESTTDVCANPTAPDYRQDPTLSPQNSVSLADMNKDTSFQDSNTPPKVTFADGAPCQDFTALGLPVLAYENASYAKSSKQTLQIQCSGQKAPEPGGQCGGGVGLLLSATGFGSEFSRALVAQVLGTIRRSQMRLWDVSWAAGR